MEVRALSCRCLADEKFSFLSVLACQWCGNALLISALDCVFYLLSPQSS